MFTVAIVVGVLLGYALGGRLGHLESLRFRRLWPMIPAALAQALVSFTPGFAAARFPVIVASYVVVGVTLVAYLRSDTARTLRGAMAVITLGWLLNLLPLVTNRGMPVSVPAAQAIGLRPDRISTSGWLKHTAMAAHTHWAALGDRWPLWHRFVISIGDMVMAVGLIVLVAAAMRPPRRTEPAGRDPAYDGLPAPAVR